jgi:hypothetical protein
MWLSQKSSTLKDLFVMVKEAENSSSEKREEIL